MLSQEGEDAAATATAGGTLESRCHHLDLLDLNYASRSSRRIASGSLGMRKSIFAAARGARAMPAAARARELIVCDVRCQSLLLPATARTVFAGVIVGRRVSLSGRGGVREQDRCAR